MAFRASFGLGVVLLATPAMAQQAADNCTAAPILAVNTTVNSSTLGSTSEILQTCGAADSFDVWYRFIAAAAGVHTITVSGFNIDPTVAVFSTCSGSPLACNDDISFPDDLDARVAINLAQNQTVRIRIAANFQDEGNFSIRVDGPAGTTLPNDACDAAGVATLSLGVTVMGSNVGANTSVALLPASCGGFAGSDGGADVFYTFMPTSTGDFSVDTCGSSFDTVLGVFSGCPSTQSNLLACNDDASPVCAGPNTSRIDSVTLTGGQPALIRVAGYRGPTTATGTFMLTIRPATTPGACCRGSTCSVVAATECMGSGTSFVGSSTVCNPAGNTTQPCCVADFNRAGGVTVQDVFDFLFAYFNANPAADANGDSTVAVGDIFAYLVAYFGPTC